MFILFCLLLFSSIFKLKLGGLISWILILTYDCFWVVLLVLPLCVALGLYSVGCLLLLQRNKANVLDSLPIVIFSPATYLPSDSQTVISQHRSVATGKVSLSLPPWGS